MSKQTRQLKADAKAAAWHGILRLDDKSGEEHRRMAAHAHVMTHHALELDTPEAHQAAAAAHQKVADMHEEAAESLEPDEVEAPAAKPKPKAGK